VFEQLIVCLDGSSLAEQIMPLARGLTRATAGKLIFCASFKIRRKCRPKKII
jgi:hypothetical protein